MILQGENNHLSLLNSPFSPELANEQVFLLRNAGLPAVPRRLPRMTSLREVATPI